MNREVREIKSPNGFSHHFSPFPVCFKLPRKFHSLDLDCVAVLFTVCFGWITHTEEKTQLASNKTLVWTLIADKLTVSFVKASIRFFKWGQDWVNLWFMLKDKNNPRLIYLQCVSGPTGTLLILPFHKQLRDPNTSKKRLCQRDSTAGGRSACFIRGV